MDTLLLGILISLVTLLLLGVGALVYLLLRRPPDVTGLLTPLQRLTQALGDVGTEMGRLSERVSAIERGQGQAGQHLTALNNQLTELRAHAKARQDLEQRTAESIRRLEAVIAGTQSKGVAGENIIEFVFAQLPPEWQVRNFQVGNKTVEFGLRLPNNLVLPIDSKWAATHLLEQFLASEDLAEQQQLKAQIERAVLSRAREVRRYIDPSVTVSFGIAAVPDAVFDLCCGIQVEVLQANVVLVSYSMFVPYLLLVFQTMLKTSRNIDLQKLNAYLDSVQAGLQALQGELEGRFSKALTMLGNSRDDMRVHLSKVNSGLTSLRLGAAGAPQLEDAGSPDPAGES